MGCNCRSGRPSPSGFRRASLPVSTPRKSLCVTLEAEGNNLTVTVSDGRLYLNPPFSTSLPVSSLLSSLGCSGQFAKALLSAETKLASIYSSTVTKDRFISIIPGTNLKFGFLRDVLRSF